MGFLVISWAHKLRNRIILVNLERLETLEYEFNNRVEENCFLRVKQRDVGQPDPRCRSSLNVQAPYIAEVARVPHQVFISPALKQQHPRNKIQLRLRYQVYRPIVFLQYYKTTSI